MLASEIVTENFESTEKNLPYPSTTNTWPKYYVFILFPPLVSSTNSFIPPLNSANAIQTLFHFQAFKMSFLLPTLRTQLATPTFTRQALRATRSLSTTASLLEPARNSSNAPRKVEVGKPKGSRQYAALSEHIGGDVTMLNTNRFSSSEIREGASYLVDQGLATDGLTYDHRVTWGEVDQVSTPYLIVSGPLSFGNLISTLPTHLPTPYSLFTRSLSFVPISSNTSITFASLSGSNQLVPSTSRRSLEKNASKAKEHSSS